MAADDAQVTSEGEGVGDNFTVGLMNAISDHLTSLVTEKDGKNGSLLENERTTDEVWMEGRADIRALVVYF